MPDGNEIVAVSHDGIEHHFPIGTDAAIIDATMKRYVSSSQPGAMQTRPGGPIINAKNIGGTTDTDATLGSAVREGLLGFGGAFGPETATKDPSQVGGFKERAGELASGLNKQVNEAATVPWGQGGPIWGTLAMLARNLMGAAHGAASGVEELGSGAINKDLNKAAHGGGAALGNFLTLGLLKGTPEAASDPLGMRSIKGGMREIMGEGTSKSRLLADQHAHALAARDHLSTVADAVHTDAQTAMSSVLSKVDEAHPEGAFSKADIQGKVKSAVGDLVQVPEKMPPSVAKILKEEKPTWENLAMQKDVSGFVNRLKSGGLGDAEIRETLRNQGYSEREIGGMTGGGTAVDSLTAEQLKQMRSDVGQELGRYGEKGTVGAALKKVYGTLSQELRGAAANAGIEREWLEANNKYSQYAKDFQRGPLKRVLGGGTASGIMEPLTGTTRQQLIDTLQKYKDAGFNVNMDALQDEMRRYGMSKTVNRLSQPTKMDLLMAGFSPKALAIRQLGPRLMRNPKAIDRFAGKGFDTPISPRQVYPTKAAAMKATRGPETDVEMDIRRGNVGPAQSMSEDIRDAEARTAADAEAKRQAWERRKKE